MEFMKLVEVRKSTVHGKGVFALEDIEAGTLLVESHMVLIDKNDDLPEELATLQFPWDEDYDAICLSDVGSFFNHDSQPSAEVTDRDFGRLIQKFTAKVDIAKDQEITIYYNDAFERFVKN